MGDRGNVNLIFKNKDNKYEVLNFYTHYFGDEIGLWFAKKVLAGFYNTQDKLEELKIEDNFSTRFFDKTYMFGAFTTEIAKEYGSEAGLGFGVELKVVECLDDAIKSQQDNGHTIISLLVDSQNITISLYIADSWVDMVDINDQLNKGNSFDTRFGSGTEVSRFLLGWDWGGRGEAEEVLIYRELKLLDKKEKDYDCPTLEIQDFLERI